MSQPKECGWRILVVDDEPGVCDSVRKTLLFEGHRVEATSTAAEALNLLRKDRFDLVIVDYEMPVMGGIELAVAIEALVPAQPIIMITAYPEALMRSNVPLQGVDLVLSKPFALDDMRQAIAKLLPKR